MAQGANQISTTPPLPGATLVSAANTALAALLSQYSGTSAPASPVKFQAWVDTSGTPIDLLKIWDGTQWIIEAVYDETNHQVYAPIGGGTGTLASATTTNLGSLNQTDINITGTVAITSFGSSAFPGQVKFLKFSGALTLTNSANIVNPSGANIVTAAGDTATVVYQGAGIWIVWQYQRASGQALISTAAASTTNTGRLVLVDATHVAFQPYNGSFIQLAGAQVAVPSGGISALISSCFLNGVAAQTLSLVSGLGGTPLHYVYVFSNGGTPTLDFCGTAHSTDATAGNVGVEIKTGDNTRTLVGMIYVVAGPNFVDSVTQRYVASWFNRRGRTGYAFFSANRTRASATPAEINAEIRVNFLTWADEEIDVTINAIATGDTTLFADIRTSIDFDLGTIEDGSGYGQEATTGGVAIPAALTVHKLLAEGQHFATVFGANNFGTATWLGAGSPPIRTTLYLGVRS